MQKKGIKLKLLWDLVNLPSFVHVSSFCLRSF